MVISGKERRKGGKEIMALLLWPDFPTLSMVMFAIYKKYNQVPSSPCSKCFFFYHEKSNKFDFFREKKSLSGEKAFSSLFCRTNVKKKKRSKLSKVTLTCTPIFLCVSVIMSQVVCATGISRSLILPDFPR